MKNSDHISYQERPQKMRLDIKIAMGQFLE